MISENDEYGRFYSDNKFWKKIKKYAKAMGAQLILKALILYYVLNDSKTPKWAKAIIISALGYLIFPFDAIPDFIPFTGYTDDLTALTCALASIALSVRKTHKTRANETLNTWFNS